MRISYDKSLSVKDDENMEIEKFDLKCLSYLKTLCEEIPEQCVESEGNRMAFHFFEDEISSLGWDTLTVKKWWKLPRY
jgi:hypothetical protein